MATEIAANSVQMIRQKCLFEISILDVKMIAKLIGREADHFPFKFTRYDRYAEHLTQQD
jgi:hypothetical protein